MDLKKEVKLSDLFRRGKGPVEEDVAIEEKPAKEKKPRTSFSFSRAKKEPKAPKEQNVSPKSSPPPPAVPLMRAFDLMPNESEREKTAASPAFLKIVVALVALLVLAALAGAFMLMSARANDRQAEADDLRAQLAELTAQATPDVDQGAGAIAGEGQARTAALSEALAARVAWDRILREFSLVLPQDVWMTSIASTTGAATTTPGGRPLRRRGRNVHHQRPGSHPGGRGGPPLAPRGGPGVLECDAAIELARCGLDDRGRGERQSQRLQLLDRRDDRAGGGACGMKKQIPVAVIVLPALLILAAVGYFLLIKPKQDAAGRLSGEIADARDPAGSRHGRPAAAPGRRRVGHPGGRRLPGHEGHA